MSNYHLLLYNFFEIRLCYKNIYAETYKITREIIQKTRKQETYTHRPILKIHISLSRQSKEKHHHITIRQNKEHH